MYVEGEATGTVASLDWLNFDTLTNGAGIYNAATEAPRAWVREANSTTTSVTGGGAAVAIGVVQKIAATFETNNTVLTNQGTSGSADASNTPPTGGTLKFAQSVFGGTQSLYIKKVALFSRALSLSERQSITT
jgi:hypothetical protein